MKIDQIKKGITKLIGEIQHQNDRMANFERQLNENQSSAALQESFAEMKEDMIETEQRFKNDIDELVALSDDLGDEIYELNEENTKFDARLRIIEDQLYTDRFKKRIPRQADGSAKVFSLDTLGEYLDQLPNASKCNELGEVLENEMDRSLNALFVMSDNNNTLLCELEYGMTEWSLTEASIADRAHVITKE